MIVSMGNGMGEDALPKSGAQFGKYRIVRRHGAGAFGAVYEALLPGPMGFAKRVAIKRLHPHVVEGDERFVQAMINEARIGGLLHHANVVDIIEFGQVEDHYYLAMEFVDGPNLSEIIQLCRSQRVLLPRFAIIDLAIQICRGLHYAHQLKDRDGTPLNLVHRDLKPSNIIVDRQGTAKILDFGIAKAASNLYNDTTPGFAKGTPRYMSPEQLHGDSALFPRSDVFALGIVLYELITVRALFSAESMIALMNQIVSADLTARLEEAEAAFPGSASILARALERDPEKRYQNARDLGVDLRVLGHAFPPEAETAEVIKRLLPRFQRTESREIYDSGDLELDDSQASAPQTQATPYDVAAIESPGPRSSGWDRFTSAFDVSAERQIAGNSQERAELTQTDPVSTEKRIPRDPTRVDDSILAAWRVRRQRPFIRALEVLGVVAVLVISGVLLAPMFLDDARGGGGGVGSASSESSPADAEEESGEQDAVAAADDDSADGQATSAPVAPIDVPETGDVGGGEPKTGAPPVEPTTPASVELPAPALEPATPAPVPAPKGGTIALHVTQWSLIYVDGAKVDGDHFLRNHPLSGGQHTIKLICGPPICPPQKEKIFSVWIDGDTVHVDGKVISEYPHIDHDFLAGTQ